MNFTTGKELLALCETHQWSISKVMMEREKTLFPDEHMMQKMEHAWDIMKQAVRLSLEHEGKSMGGLIGGEARKLNAYRESGRSLCGTMVSKAITYAMGVLEVNTSMGLIVAAPTAGSSGVIPGVFMAMKEALAVTDEQLIEALFHAGAIGYIISRNATVSGAEGGCQAEVGSASAMAASAVTELMGGTPKQCLDAAASAIMNILGMVCDPVAGLVEVPCQKRNALGASNAIICAEMTLSGVDNLIPFDEVVEAMYKVGKAMPEELRETALGGVAATKTGCSLCKSAMCFVK